MKIERERERERDGRKLRRDYRERLHLMERRTETADF
jgi:hypothetical protein